MGTRFMMVPEEEVRQKDREIAERRLTSKGREQVILEHVGLVKRIAYRIVSRLPDTIHVEDLISIGMLGLIDAVEKYDPDKGKGFRAYAELRIRGAILDELRGYDSLSRANRRRANELFHTALELEQRLGREASDEELAAELNMDLEELHAARNSSRSLVFLDIDDSESNPVIEAGMGEPVNAQGEYEQFRNLAGKHMQERLTSIIEKLPEKLRLVLSLYYYNELNYKEIGEVMDLSESRISQLHSKAIVKVRKALMAQETKF